MRGQYLVKRGRRNLGGIAKLSIFIWFIFVTYVIIVVSWYIGHEMKKFPISVVELNGNIEHTAQRDIDAVVQHFVNVSFFSLQNDALKKSLLTLPWIADVDVTRVWPGKVVIRLTEKQVLAKWGKSGFVTTKGEVFYPSGEVDLKNKGKIDLPIFLGEPEKAAKMLEKYQFLQAKVSTLGLNIKELEIMPDHGWRAMLDNGVVVFLGRDAIAERTKRFMLAYKGLQAKMTRISYIDARYTNGVSVGWK